MDVKPQSKKPGDVAGRLLQKMLMPIVATAASAAATYAAKKAPQLLERSVLPKIRELVDGVGGAAQGLPAKARAAAGEAGEAAERLTERARSAAGSAGNGQQRQRVAPRDLDRRLQFRARARAERRKVSR